MYLKPQIIKTSLWISLTFILFNCTSNKKVSPSAPLVRTQKTPKLPRKILFFNDYIPITDFDLRERLDRELLVNTYFQSSTSIALKRATRYFPTIERILKEEGVPDDFKYLCVIESNLSNVTSPAGAAGFWQFMPGTAPEYGIKITSEIDERNHLEKSTRAACQLIKNNYTLFNDWVNACAAYNRGPGGLMQDMKSQGVKHFFDTEMNPETARYVFRIMALKLIMEHPADYGYQIPKTAQYSPIKCKVIHIKNPINNIAMWARQHGTSLKNIRILNPWILADHLSSTSIPCSIKIPANKEQLGVFKK
jgi:hypothetical protein